VRSGLFLPSFDEFVEVAEHAAAGAERVRDT